MTIKGISSFFSLSPRALTSTTFSSFPSSHTIPSSPRCSFSESMIVIEENIKNAESIINIWDLNSTPHTILFQNQRKEAKEFLTSVRNLRRSMDLLVSEDSASDKLVLCHNLIQIAMKRIEHEFYRILSQNHKKLDAGLVSGRLTNRSSNPDDDEYDSEDHGDELNGDALADLKAIAECMISCGYAKECVKIYKIMRKSIVDEVLYQHGIEKWRVSQIMKMKHEAAEFMMRNWVSAVKNAVKMLFSREKITCDHVLSVSQRLRESCFRDITKEGATNLFRFPQLISEIKHKKSPDAIFGLMELHRALTELWPEIESIFNFESTSDIKMQAHSSLEKLGDSVRSILSDFEATIHKHSSKALVPGGGIHPLTESAISHISSLAEYSETLDIMLAHYLPPGSPTFQESYFGSPASNDCKKSAVSIHFGWLLLVLLCRLDSKAKMYKDVSLSYLFLANNLQFIIEKVQTSHLKELLGDEWVLRHDKKIRQFALSYETIAWSRVYATLMIWKLVCHFCFRTALFLEVFHLHLRCPAHMDAFPIKDATNDSKEVQSSNTRQ